MSAFPGKRATASIERLPGGGRTRWANRRTAAARRCLAGAFAVTLGCSPGLAAISAAEDTSAYGRLLARHVRPGTADGIRSNLVDYGKLAADPDYAEALRDLEAATPDALPTREEAFAFWVNAYNLLAIKTIVDRYPIASIRDAGTLFNPIWKKDVGVVGGKPYSLDGIEHGILRMSWKEPRVHFALVCASLSCPDLRTEPYDGNELEKQLAEQTRSFLANETKGMVPASSGKAARVSSIFKWFRGDFDAAGGVAAFVKANSDPAVAAKVPELTDAGLSYIDYDWDLNDTQPAAR